MKQNHFVKLCLSFVLICFFSSSGFCASSYDRELIVQDKTRAMQVESVFKEMMAAYEDEDARGFLNFVSDERFRQDYITFTDALYSDFRNYEIHQVEYWIDKIVPDNVKQFLFVQWEKRYENLDDGRQLIQKGSSRFLFDEVDGEYLLIELAGNNLFGGSLQEWVEEVPPIAGQEAVASSEDEGKPDLLITAASQSSSAVSVASFYMLSFTVKNIGTTSSSLCTLEAVPNGSYPQGFTYTIDPLAPNESRSYGQYQGPMMQSLNVDIDDDVDESNENNNSYKFTGLP